MRTMGLRVFSPEVLDAASLSKVSWALSSKDQARYIFILYAFSDLQIALAWIEILLPVQIMIAARFPGVYDT